MTKLEAIAMFGGSQADLARAIGVTRSYVCQWPDELRPEIADRVIGAAVRLGKLVPVLVPANEAERGESTIPRASPSA